MDNRIPNQIESKDQPQETENEQETTAPPAEPAEQIPASPTTQSPAPAGGVIEKDGYIKVKGPDETGKGMWLLLTDDNGATNAHYAKNDAKDGFAKVKGVMKTENGKTFLEISELSAES